MFDEEEYSEEYMDYQDAVAGFFRKMLLNKIFQRLPHPFTYNDFKISFQKGFKSMGITDEDAKAAFTTSIELEIIQIHDEEKETYAFNGLSIYSEDWN